jgi:hypothetical protein
MNPIKKFLNSGAGPRVLVAGLLALAVMGGASTFAKSNSPKAKHQAQTKKAQNQAKKQAKNNAKKNKAKSTGVKLTVQTLVAEEAQDKGSPLGGIKVKYRCYDTKNHGLATAASATTGSNGEVTVQLNSIDRGPGKVRCAVSAQGKVTQDGQVFRPRPRVTTTTGGNISTKFTYRPDGSEEPQEPDDPADEPDPAE